MSAYGLSAPRSELLPPLPRQKLMLETCGIDSIEKNVVRSGWSAVMYSAVWSIVVSQRRQ